MPVAPSASSVTDLRAKSKLPINQSGFGTVKQFFEANKSALTTVLPNHVNADAMLGIALGALRTTPKLRECSIESLFGAVVKAAQLGLDIGIRGQAFLVPYGKECQLQPGWMGINDLVLRTGRASIWTGAVFEGDQFEYAKGDSPFVRHIEEGESDPKLMTHVYAIGRINGAQWPIIEVWKIAKVWKHRDKINKQGKSHYSFAYPEMYARKVVLLQVAKYMPASRELSEAIGIDAMAEQGTQKIGSVLSGEWSVVDDPESDGEATADETPTTTPTEQPKMDDAWVDAATKGA